MDPEIEETPVEDNSSTVDSFDTYVADDGSDPYFVPFGQPDTGDVPFYKDPAFLTAVRLVESNGDDSAISPKGAKGPFQFMDATWEQYGKGGNVFDRADAEAAASRYFEKMATQNFDGDIKKTIAGYNAGEGAVEKHGGIPPYKETQQYVNKVMAKYAALKGEQIPEGQPQNEPEKFYETDGRGFASALFDTIQGNDFDALSYPEKVQKLNEIFTSRNWGADAYDTLKETATFMRAGAEPSEILPIEGVVSPPPITKENPQKELQAWRERQLQDMVASGVSPAVFGTALDDYFKKASDEETQAFNYRNRGWLASTFGFVGNNVREATKGVAGIVTKPAAGVARLAGGDSVADSIESIPESVLGTPANDYLYVVDPETGRIAHNQDGTPKTRWQAQIAQGIGMVGGMMSGGIALRLAGYAEGAIGATFGGVNALTGANDNFKETYAKTNDRTAAYASALYALPAAALATFPELAVVSKIANPAVPYMSQFNQIRYMAGSMARNAAMAGAGNAAYEYTLQLGKFRNANIPFDVEGIGVAAIYGAVPAAGLSAYHGAKVRPEMDPADSNAPIFPGPFDFGLPLDYAGQPLPNTSGILRGDNLPAVYQPPGLPARIDPNFQLVEPKPQLALPDSGARVGPETRKPRVNPAIDDETHSAVVDKLQAFQKDSAATMTITAEEARSIGTELYDEPFHITGVPQGENVVLTKKSSYAKSEPADTVEGLTAQIKAIEQEMIEQGSPTYMPISAKKRQSLKEQRNLLQEQLRSLTKHTTADMTAQASVYKQLKSKVDDLHAQIRTETDPELRRILREDLTKAQAEYKAFTKPDEAPYYNKMAELDAEMKRVEEMLRYGQRKLYQNDLSQMKASWEEKVALRNKMQAEERAKADLPPEQITSRIGTKVNDHDIILHNGKFYTHNNKGEIVGVSDYYYDAVELTNLQSDSTQFVTRVEPTTDRLRLTKEQDFAARKAGLNEDATKLESEIRREGDARRVEEAARQQSGVNRRYEEEGEPLFRDVKPGSQLAKDIESGKAFKPAKKQPTKRTRGKKGRTKNPGETGLSRGLENESGQLYENEKGQQVFATKPLGLTLAAKERLRKSVAMQGTVPSHYTQPITFAQDSNKVVKPRQVAAALQDLAKSMGKNTRIFYGGRVAPWAYLNYGKDYIKVGQFDDMVSTAHEVGHQIDRFQIGKWGAQGYDASQADYSHIPQDVQDAFKGMADVYYPFRDPPTELDRMQEGISTFFQHYLSGQPVDPVAQRWYEGAFKQQEPKTYDAIEDIKDLSFDYYNQTPLTAMKGQLERKKTTFDKVKESNIGSMIRDNWIDRQAALRDLDNLSGLDAKGERQTAIKDAAEAYAGQARQLADEYTKTGPVDMNGYRLSGPGLLQILHGAEGKIPELDAYLAAWRKYAEYKKGRNPGSNQADIEGTLDEIQKSRDPEMAKVTRAANQWWNLYDQAMEVVHDSSMEGKDLVQKIWKENLKAGLPRHGYYSPSERYGKEGFNPLKKPKGSTRPVISPLSNFENSLEALFTRANNARLKETLFRQVGNHVPGNSTGLMIRNVTGQERVGLLKQLDDAAPKGATAEEKYLALFGSEGLPGITSENHRVLTSFENGKIKFYEVDNRLYNAMHPEISDIVQTPVVKYLLRPAAGFTRMMATTLNPLFTVKNFIRDNESLYRHIKSGEGDFKDMLNLTKAVLQSFWDVGWYKAGHNNTGYAALGDRLGVRGATRQSFYRDSREALGPRWKGKVLDVIDTSLTAFESFLSTGEEAVRTAALRVEAKRLGIKDPNQKLSPLEAIALSLAYKRSTTNFQIQGSSASTWNAIVPFFTARIAEISRLPGDYRRNPRRFGAIAAAGLVGGILHAISHKDADWYKELTAHDRVSTAWITTNVNGVEKMVRIPLDNWTGFGWGLGQAIGEKMTEDPKMPIAMGEWARAYFGQHAPVSSPYELAGPIIKEIIQQDNNRDYFFDKDIIPPNLRFHNPKFQYNEYTTQLAKTAGEYFDVSPMRVDHAIRSLAPAAANFLSFGEKVIGKRKAEEAGAMDYILSALTKAGNTSAQADKSQADFTENLDKFRANKPEESPEEANVRKSLEKINKATSAIKTLRFEEDDQKIKDAYRRKERDLLRLGNAIAKGSGEKVPPIPELRQAEKVRKQRRTELQATAAEKRKADAGYSLLGDSDSEE